MEAFAQVSGLIRAAVRTTIEHVYEASRHGAAVSAVARGSAVPGAPGSPAALARLDELLACTRALADDVDGCAGWTGRDRRRALAAMDVLAGVLATVRGSLVTAERAAQGGIGVGDRDFVAARARAGRTGLGEARREVRQAETLAEMPTVAGAVSGGRVPLPHLDALGRVAERAGERARAELARPETQERLVGLAERSSLREFTAAAARLVASFDPAGTEDAAARQRDARYLVLSRQVDGTVLKGRLDHLSAEVLRTAIAGVGMAPDEERSKPQADADALVALAERAVSGMAGVRARRTSPSGTLLADPEQDAADGRVSGVANRPTVAVLVPAETYAEVQRVQRRRAAPGDGSGTDEAAWRAVEPAALEDGTPLAMSELARMLCDCEIGRIVLSADGQPMDLGRTERLYTGQQRRAVIVRDRSCAWNGCDVPAAYCEVHHIRWWDRDLGPTSVENGVLLCSHHHHVVHRCDLDIVRLGRPPSRGPMLGEPCRYTFGRRDGRVVNAPPGVVGGLAGGLADRLARAG